MITPLPDCPCRHCLEKRDLAEGLLFPSRMPLCPTCGNKRCPRAYNHTLSCSGSNEPGQTGSVFDRTTTLTEQMQNPITIPPELLSLWEGEAQEKSLVGSKYVEYVATKAGQYCADQELEACCEWIDTPAEFETVAWNGKESDQLRAARRPKPHTLAEQGLKTLDWIESESPWDKAMFDPLRSALERLRELEGNG